MLRYGMLRLINLGLRGLTLVSKLLLLFFVARFLEPAEVGLYGLLAATISYSIFLVGFDFYTYTTRELLKNERSQWGRLIKSQVALSARLYLVFIPLLSIIFLTGMLPLGFAPWFVLLLMVEHVGQELNRVLVALSEQITASLMLFLRFGVWALVVVGLMHFNAGARNLGTIFEFWLAGGSAACLLGVWKLSRLRIGGWDQPVDWTWVKRGLMVATPFLLATLALRSLSTIDRYWIEALGGLEVLGAYVLFIGMASALISFLDAGVFVFFYPRLISAAHSRDSGQFRMGMRSLATQTIVLAAAFVSIALVIIGPLLAWIDRSAYLDHGYIFPWILLATFINAVSMIPHYGLYAQGFDRHIIRSHVAGLAAFVIATWIASLARVDLAVPIGLCVAFGLILVWKSFAYIWLTPRHLRGVRPYPVQL